jgi:predicted nucleic acid-binding protein
MMHNSVLLDTSFFVRLLNEADPLAPNAGGYYKYFLEKQIPMVVSTISIAEYCVKGSVDELPLRNLRILPFNLPHAARAGAFAEVVFKKKDLLNLPDRKIIPNDTKLFAQADVEDAIGFYLTSDRECKKIFDLLKMEGMPPKFDFLDLNISHESAFGILF